MVGGEGVEAGSLVLLVRAEANPRLEPPFAGEIELERGGELVFGKTIKVNRKHVANGCAGVVTILEGVGAAEHEEAATAFGYKALDQEHLVGRKEARFDIVENDGFEIEEILWSFWKSIPKFLLVFGIQANQNGLVVALRFLFVELVEAAEERIAGFAGVSLKIEFGFAAGDANEGDELDLRIFGDGAVEKFELPIRTAGDVEDAMGAGTAIDRDETLIIVGRGFDQVSVRGVVIGKRKAKVIEGDALLFRFEFEAKGNIVAGFIDGAYVRGDDLIAQREFGLKGGSGESIRARYGGDGYGRIFKDCL